MSDLIRRWDARYREADSAQVAPAEVLRENAHLLPAAGDALEVACGLGGNALFLAERGLNVQAWDISGVAIERLAETAGARELRVQARQRDVVAHPPEPASVDVLVVTRFLERDLAPALCAALRPGGLVFYQTFTRETVDAGGPSNPAFRLAPNELLDMFRDLRLLVYREEGRVGRLDEGFRNEALLVARKP